MADIPDSELVDDTDEAELLPVVPMSSSEFNSAPDVRSARLHGESLKSVMENYVRYYAKGQGHTARAKRYDLEYFLEFLAGGPDRIARVRVSDWTLQLTKDFMDQRLGLGESPATVARRLATLKHFGRTIAERVPGYINPAREVKSPVIPQTRPKGLSAEEIQLLQRAANEEIERRKDPFLATRNRFLIELLLATGLRADEVRVLVMAQISADERWLKNVKTKGRRFRNVYLDSQIRDLFRSYLDLRDETLRTRYPFFESLSVNEMSRYPVLISHRGSTPGNPASFGLSPKTIWRVVSDLGVRAQALAASPIENLHPHKLRHTFAHGLLDSSRDVRLVAQALGHSDVRTTMRYTERTEEEIAKAIETKIRGSD